MVSFDRFDTTFENHLSPNNRWVKLAALIPWDELASSYNKLMDAGMGATYKDARLIIGALIIKHKIKLPDEEVIEQLKENIYMQYFVGYSSYPYKQAFALGQSQEKSRFQNFEQESLIPSCLFSFVFHTHLRRFFL